jgi:hypothetical protein
MAAHHEPVIQAVIVEVQPGKLEAYRAEVKKLKAALSRLGSKATLRVWETTAAGEDTGSALVGIEYADQGTWAADTMKTQGDYPEWQKFLAGLYAIRTLQGRSLYREITPRTPERPGRAPRAAPARGGGASAAPAGGGASA